MPRYACNLSSALCSPADVRLPFLWTIPLALGEAGTCSFISTQARLCFEHCLRRAPDLNGRLAPGLRAHVRDVRRPLDGRVAVEHLNACTFRALATFEQLDEHPPILQRRA